MESQILPKIDGKSLEFTIDIQDAQFNHEGWYRLDISLQNSHTSDYSQVKMMKGDSGVFVNQRQTKTDPAKQEQNNPLTCFEKKKFTFRLPRGFCKNDKNHEVYLLVEAFSLRSKTDGQGKKVGEGKFAIYPRTNAPRINLYAEPGEDLYHYTGIISLLRTHSTDNIQMHCGRIRSEYSLKEVVPQRYISPTQTPVRTPPKQQKIPERKPPSPIHPPPRRQLTPTPRRYEEKREPPKQQKDPPPQTAASSWGENLSLNLPPSPPLPAAADSRTLPETPLKGDDRRSFFIDRTYRHVGQSGREQIDVILHGATSLPQTPNGKVPLPYGVVKTKTDEDKELKTGATTHTSSRPTHAPSWEEILSISVDEEKAEEEMLVVSVGDSPTQKGLVNYRMPISSLTPFHQYHLELNMPAKGIPSGVRTFATIMRKPPRLPKDPSSPNYVALEVLLIAVQKPIQAPLGPLIAVARIVPDYYNYKSDNLLSHPRNAGVIMNNVTFPSPHPSTFVVTQRNYHGHPQLSLPGRPENQPRWNHPYLFVEERDKATLFTPGAALVIEYYVASMAMSDQFWRMQAPVAFSALLMDEDMYKQLMEERAKNGLRLEGLPVQGSDMVTATGSRPTVGMVLRLITTECPDSLVSVSNYDDLPQLDMFPPSDVPDYYRVSPDILKVTTPSSQPPDATSLASRQPPPPPSPEISPLPLSPEVEPQRTRKAGYYLQRVKKRPLSPIKDSEPPPMSAMETILPEYQYIFYDGEGDKKSPTRAAGPPPQQSHRAPPEHPHASHNDAEDLDMHSMNLLDHQSKELGNYRGAVNKMGQDILALRNQVRELENINSNLRRDLANYNDASRLMVESADLDGLTKPEILSRYAAIKQTLSTQTTDLKSYKTKVQALQNDLIKKNDQEKEYLSIQKAHTAQQVLIQRLQEKLKKMKKLEETCKQQEDVIQKMEKVLEKHHKDRAKYQKDKASQDANEVLLQENKRLRSQIDELKSQLLVGGSSGMDDQEKLELYQALEKADGRIASLEKQLSENSRLWGKERADMSLRLNEAEHGFGRTTGMILHDYDVFNDRYPKGRSGLKQLAPMYR